MIHSMYASVLPVRFPPLGSTDMDSEEEASYQIELEIVKPEAVDDIYKFQNILQKVADLSKLISV